MLFYLAKMKSTFVNLKVISASNIFPESLYKHSTIVD